MKIAILSCFYPFRGGISQFNACLYDALSGEHEVRAFNFKRQYPEFLFPGKTQYVTPNDEAVPVESTSLLDTVSPFSWRKTAREIRRWKPDLLIMGYWMSWFAPSLGWIGRRCRCRSIAVLHNVVPHEKRFFDIPLTKYFLKGCDGFVTMADVTTGDLLRFIPDAKYILRSHPLYSHFGEKLPREKAEDLLGLEHGKKNILFFGLIREYKGLDILLEAFRGLGDDYRLIIAGEPYGSFQKYQSIIDTLPGKDRIHLFPEYIRDSEVKKFFSAADVTVLPYRSATQSGISSVSYHFEVPMIVTDVGGLKYTIGDRGTGIVVPSPDAEEVRRGILSYFEDPSLRESCIQAIRLEKDRLSWKRFAEDLSAFAETL